jgi:hypothetical protein
VDLGQVERVRGRGAADELLKMRGKLDIEDVSRETRAIDRRI